MTGVVPSLLKELVQFLQLFKIASDELEATKSVTLHLPVPWYYRLQQHCRLDSNDSEPMAKIKTRAASFIDSKFKIGRLHLLATVLNPKMKGLKMLPDVEKQAVYDDLRHRVEWVPVQATTITSNVSGRPICEAEKRQRKNVFLFSISHILSYFKLCK